MWRVIARRPRDDEQDDDVAAVQDPLGHDGRHEHAHHLPQELEGPWHHESRPRLR